MLMGNFFFFTPILFCSKILNQLIYDRWRKLNEAGHEFQERIEIGIEIGRWIQNVTVKDAEASVKFVLFLLQFAKVFILFIHLNLYLFISSSEKKKKKKKKKKMIHLLKKKKI
mgnify:CR=1 FL=1